MSVVLTFKERILAVVVPTKGQVMSALAVSLVILVVGQSQGLLDRLGISGGVLHSISQQFHRQFDSTLRSQVASQLAIITFWAVVGLVAYLVCWGAYNMFVEARNEVTLNTVYTNRGHWRSPYHTLGLKAAAAAALVLGVASIWAGMALWMALFQTVITRPDVISAVFAAVGWVGCAIHLYLILALAQLTFTPWYRAEAFTED